MGTILLLALVVLTLALVYQDRKHKRDLKDRETRIAMAQNVNTLNIDMNTNNSYIPMFRRNSMESNAAYDEIVNQDSSGVYETIMSIKVLTEENTQTQDIAETQNKEEHAL